MLCKQRDRMPVVGQNRSAILPKLDGRGSLTLSPFLTCSCGVLVRYCGPPVGLHKKFMGCSCEQPVLFIDSLRGVSMAKRGRPSSDQHEDLPEKVTARFTVLEKAALAKMCEVEGVTLSAFIRARVFGKRLASKSDSTMLNELRRQGGLLKHLCHEGHLSPEEIGPVLNKIMIALDAIVTGAEVAKFRNELKSLAVLVEKMYRDGVVNAEQVLGVLKALKAAFDRYDFGK